MVSSLLRHHHHPPSTTPHASKCDDFATSSSPTTSPIADVGALPSRCGNHSLARRSTSSSWMSCSRLTTSQVRAQCQNNITMPPPLTARTAVIVASTSSSPRSSTRTSSAVIHRASSPRRSSIRLDATPLDATGGDPYELTQLVSVAGTVAALGATALALGARGEPKPCAACASSGGEPCAFCDATGRRTTPIRVSKRERDDDGVLGLTRRNPYECTACKGAGMILCRACRGSGYVD